MFEIFCDPGSKPTVMLASSALCFWQQFTEIPRLQCPWHTHPCRTQLRGNRWRALWCCRIKALNPVPAISVAGAEFIVCDTKLCADTYLVCQIFVNVKHISVWKCLIMHTNNVRLPWRNKFDSSTCSYLNANCGKHLMRDLIQWLFDVLCHLTLLLSILPDSFDLAHTFVPLTFTRHFTSV